KPGLCIALGSLNGFIAVAMGAFAAHGLAARLEPRLLETFRTGAQYQMYHALALVLIGVMLQRQPSAVASNSAWAMLAGIVLFSGSLYALALTGMTRLGIITPFGGVAFLAGWAMLAFAAWQSA